MVSKSLPEQPVQFRGSFPALITPMKNGKVDEQAFRKFVNWQIEQGSHGLVPVGTTGESPTLTPEEHKQVIEICIEEARERTVSVDNFLESLVRSMLRRPQRWELPEPPEAIRKQAELPQKLHGKVVKR